MTRIFFNCPLSILHCQFIKSLREATRLQRSLAQHLGDAAASSALAAVTQGGIVAATAQAGAVCETANAFLFLLFAIRMYISARFPILLFANKLPG